MIEVKNLSKHYGEKKAVDNISFTVEDGIILGFLGPNGAGKSTTMNMLTGYISATSGQALINGIDILKDPIKAKEQIGYLPEMPPLYLDMTVREYLDFIYDLKKCKSPREQHIKQICSLVKITDVYERVIKHLSKGYKQRVGLAQALIGNPPILILDEPTVGLDPQQIIEIRTLIKKLGERHTVILSSHILSEIQAVCDKIIILNKGKVAANDTADNISRTLSNENKLIARIDGAKDEVIKAIKGISGVAGVTCDFEREPGVFEYEIETKDTVDIRRDLFKRMAERNWYILALGTANLTLEDIFLKITVGDNIELGTSTEKELEKIEKETEDAADTAKKAQSEKPAKNSSGKSSKKSGGDK